MQTKMVNDRLESADQVDASFAAHGDDLAVQLTERDAARVAAGAPPVDYPALLTHLRADLQAERESLAAANRVHVQKLGEMIELRQERDRTFNDEREKFKIVRQTVEGLFGSEKGFPLAGVSGRTPRDPKGLGLQMQQTADFLGSRSRALPSIEVSGLQMAAVVQDLGGVEVGIEQPPLDHVEQLSRLHRGDPFPILANALEGVLQELEAQIVGRVAAHLGIEGRDRIRL